MTNYGYSIEVLVKSTGYSKFERNFLPHTINSEMISRIGNKKIFVPCTGLNRILARRKFYEFHKSVLSRNTPCLRFGISVHYTC